LQIGASGSRTIDPSDAYRTTEFAASRGLVLDPSHRVDYVVWDLVVSTTWRWQYRSIERSDDVNSGIAFSDLVVSRCDWIETVLKPWCRSAARRELLAAEQEWVDIAGRADPRKTLWPWAWSRFPVLYVDDLGGLEETYRVTVTLRDGSRHTGYPDARRSVRGELVLLGDAAGQGLSDLGPWSIDDIGDVERS
jgi:hypothetical protein